MSHSCLSLFRSNLFRPGFSCPLRRVQWLHYRGLMTSSLNGPLGRRSLRLLMISGFFGGATATLIGGYAFYHWSGMKTVVDAARHPINFLRYQPHRVSPVEAGVDAQLETKAQILAALRSLAKAYVAPLPGASILVDVAFNEIDRAVDTHKDEIVSILKSAYSEVQTAVKIRGRDAKETAWDVLAILRNRLGEVEVSALGQDRIGPIFERIPGFREHASRTSDVHESLSLAFHKGLEKGKSALFGELKKLKSTLLPEQDKPSTSVKPAETNTKTQAGELVEEH